MKIIIGRPYAYVNCLIIFKLFDDGGNSYKYAII